MARKSAKAMLWPILFLLMASSADAQTANLLKNPNADEGTAHWRAFGKAEVDEATGSFILRDGGYFLQDTTLPEGAVGQYAVLIGRASSERINTDGAITGLPSLYGYMMNAGEPSGGRIYDYLQGQRMLSSAKAPNEWAYLWGIFQVPAGTGAVRFFLSQGERQGVPQNGSAARFDDLGLYLFPTEEEATTFVNTTTGNTNAAYHKTKTSSVARKPQCKLTLNQAPELYGLRLGMSAEDIAALFPGGKDNPDIRRAIEMSHTSANFGHARLRIDPRKHDAGSKYAEVKSFMLRTLDGRVVEVFAEFNGPQRNSVDEFISSRAAEMKLPRPEEWEHKQPISSKYLVCDGFEIHSYSAPQRSNNFNYIIIVDTSAEKTLNIRRAEAKDGARQ